MGKKNRFIYVHILCMGRMGAAVWRRSDCTSWVPRLWGGVGPASPKKKGRGSTGILS